jgi:hypothetical protein
MSDIAIKAFNLIKGLLLPTSIGRIEPPLGFIFAAAFYPETRLKSSLKTTHTKAVWTQNLFLSPKSVAEDPNRQRQRFDQG